MAAAPAAEQQAAVTLAAYQQATSRLRHHLMALVAQMWASLGVYRNAQIPTFLRQVVPAVTGGQQQMAALTAAYLAHQRQAAVGGAFRPVVVQPAKVTGAAVRNGTSPADVYERPFHLVWRQLSDGASPSAAIQSGADRAVQSVLTDLQLTKTHTARQVLGSDPNVTGFRRVLEGAHSCALCVVAATQRYHHGDLLPMHPACDCSVAPLYTPDEHVIDPEALAAAHAAVKAATGRSSADARSVDYRDFLVVHQHGELGPLLARKGAPFMGPRDL